MFAPLYPNERIVKVLQIEFSHTAVLTLRVLAINGSTHLELTLFADPVDSFYFYTLYSGQQLASIYQQNFGKMEEFCQFIFASKLQNFRIKWPADDSGNCFLLLQHPILESSELYELQIGRRDKDIDTLATIKTQINLWEIKNTQKELAAIETQLLEAEKEQFDLRLTRNKYQAFDLVQQSPHSPSYLAFAELKRLANFEQQAKSPRKKIFIGPSRAYYVQPNNHSQLMLNQCIVIDSEESGGEQAITQKSKPNRSQRDMRIEENYMQVSEIEHQNIGTSLLALRHQESSLTKHEYSKTADSILSKMADLQISPPTNNHLDFSASQFLPRYSIESESNVLLVTKIADDRSFYHIHQRFPIQKSIEQFKLIPKIINHHDFSFGILGASALMQTRMTWPVQIIAYIGCTHQIMNGFAYQKIPTCFQPGDQLTMRVLLPQRKVIFYRNSELLGEESINKDMAKECYVFYQTATLGNSVLFPLN